MKRTPIVLAGLALLLLARLVPAAEMVAPFKVREALDLRYAPGAGDRHLLDVFSPEGARERPVVILVHGGSWMFGDKNLFGLYRNVGKYFATQGVVVVMPNYQLAPRVRHPENVKDIARAFAWTRRNIKAHGGNPDCIILCGHSAGGHLVALLATDPSLLKDATLKLTERDRAALRGVIGVSGVYRIPDAEEFPRMLDKMAEQSAETMKGKGEAPPTISLTELRKVGLVLNPFKMVFGTDRMVCRLASPVFHVHAGLPPFLLLHAQDDLPLLPEMALEFGKALRAARVPVTVKKIEERNHNRIFFNARGTEDPVARLMLDFIQKTATRETP